jgi:hypothetical protein
MVQVKDCNVERPHTISLLVEGTQVNQCLLRQIGLEIAIMEIFLTILQNNNLLLTHSNGRSNLQDCTTLLVRTVFLGTPKTYNEL